MTQLMLHHAVPSSNALMTTNRGGGTTSTGTGVILQNIVFANHPSSVPNKLIHIKAGWDGITISAIRALPISFHHPLFEIGAAPLQNDRRTNKLRNVQFEVGSAAAESLDCCVSESPSGGMDAPRVRRLKHLNISLLLTTKQFFVWAHDHADALERFCLVQCTLPAHSIVDTTALGDLSFLWLLLLLSLLCGLHLFAQIRRQERSG
mmetsp:Transcript_14164/g.40640  ORF Transcript_14164/g.40640 Transcript_14164/m.40640 type:complete len:206 (-) Transcript_14164:1657-2274(-)